MVKVNVYLKFDGQTEEQYHFIKMRALKVDLAGPIVRYQDTSDKELPDEEKAKRKAIPRFLQ